MPGRPGKRLLACAVALLLAVSGCGDEEPERTIPPDAADAMIDRLTAIEASADAGTCEILEGHATALEDLIFALPAEVGTETKEALREAAANAADLARERCETEAGATGGGGSGDEETTTSAPTTETTTTEPDTTTTDETTEEPTTGEDPSTGGGAPSGGGASGGGAGNPGASPGGGGPPNPGGEPEVGGEGTVTPPSGGVAPEGGG